ncbi:NUDIX hydrolase [Variovorax sp. VNK109]|uniref:NUDIX hydrolase n=1 Tax=Variovorax sp. VNK109 TaxID=3400919 RepID=UPI003C00BEAF
MQTRWKPSVTVAAVIEREGRFLLVEEETDGGLKFNNPAGHLDPGESPVDGCVREALEETAWRIRPTALLGIYLSRFIKAATGEDITYLRFAFAAEAIESVPGRALDTGIMRALWMTPEEIRATSARHRSPLVLRCMEDFLAGKRLPLETVYTDPTVIDPADPAQGVPPDRS